LDNGHPVAILASFPSLTWSFFNPSKGHER
jgi:hypothetical protein